MCSTEAGTPFLGPDGSKHVLLRSLLFILKVTTEELKGHNIADWWFIKLILGVVWTQAGIGETNLESVLFQIWPWEIRRGVRYWCRQVLAINLMRGWYLALVQWQKSLEGGGNKHFNVGHDKLKCLWVSWKEVFSRQEEMWFGASEEEPAAGV